MKNKRGQVTIFIIIAVVIVALALLFFLVIPSIRDKQSPAQNPKQFIDACVREELEANIKMISLQGGEMNPEGYYLYDGNPVKYLCYSNRYYEFCTVQVPFLLDHLEKEIKDSIKDTTNYCFESLKENYEEKGYEVELISEYLRVDILSEIISMNPNTKVIIRKGENSEEYSDFTIYVYSNLYKMVSIARSIVEWESEFGTAEPFLYMDVYHDTIVRKLNQGDETTVYVIEDDTGKFQIASRSLAFPPGYGSLEDYI